ncbi:MAG TPA: Gfo/Idh/MocA family oxidoreductase [Candidatus Methylomirabilis sp.]|nr:Gfo/Idh/MocA family oxidoreductase [Candidatus Methylomirabilis sp.]
MTRLRGGLFGCGMISEFHLRGWRRIPEVEIVALGNRTIARAEARRTEFYPEARTYDRLETMLEREQLDFVDILTVPWLHREHCLLARQAGVHIICQKPLCDTLEAGRALVRAMEGSPRLFAVHENHRYRPWFQRIRELQGAGAFGALRVVRLEQYDPTPPPELYKLRTERGLFLEYGTHLVDMIRALLGEPLRVYARMHHVTAEVRGESHALVVYEYPGATAIVNIAWQSAGPAFGGLVLEGEGGVAYYEGTMARGASSRFRVTQGKTTVVDEPRSPYEDYVESFYLLQRECVDCMLTGKPPTQSGPENLKTLASTEAAYMAAAQGRLIEVADYRGFS